MGTPIVITGMHRSGTSLLANLLMEAGVAVGERLRGPTEGNLKGYFEDEDFVELHEAILKANGTSWSLDNFPRVLQINEVHRAKAHELISKRRNLSNWGWKDPRTSLFLDFWAALLPEARFIFVFRRAGEVVESLRRRGDRELTYHGHGAWLMRQFGFKWFWLFRAINLWLRYNGEIIRFCRAHPERSCVLDLHGLANQLPVALASLRSRWRLELRDPDISAVLDQEMLHSRVSAMVALCCWRRDVRAVYGDLSELVAASVVPS